MGVLDNVEDKERFDVDVLSRSVVNFLERADLGITFKIVKGVHRFLRQEPFIERHYCEISEKYSWLLPVSLKAIEKLISNMHQGAFSEESLYALTQASAFKEYSNFENELVKNDLAKLIPEWKELNHSLFWHDVGETRRLLAKDKNNLEYVWQVSFFGHLWHFTENDFDLIIEDINTRPLLEDRLVAVSLAYELYKNHGRTRSWLAKMKKVVIGNENLQTRLNIFLNPPPATAETKKHKKQQAQWKRRSKRRAEQRQQDHKKSLKWLSENYEKLRVSGLENGIVSNPQYYMYQKIREKSGESLSTRWTTGDWQCLIEDYGMKTAEAVRDGMIAFWKDYTPKLRSEKDEKNTTALAIIFGLSGIAIEEKEVENWPHTLSEKDAELACKYAVHEMNEFPTWFSRLHKIFPKVVNDILLHEIDWELKSEEKKHYVLDRVSANCPWLWDTLAPSLLEKIKKEPSNSENLGKTLKIIQGSSSISDLELSKIASKKCHTLNSQESLNHWFAVWIGTNPNVAIKALSTHLEEVHAVDPSAAKDQAMHVVVNLIGERRSGSSARENFKTPEHLKNFYILMHKYIKAAEDVERAGKGVYSPDLIDDAQDARGRIFSILSDIRGKETYLAMRELSETHPVEEQRMWMMHNAKLRAESDADMSPWSSEKFCEFNRSLESAPSNHQELCDLAIQRILDLKYQLEEGDDSIASTLAKEDQEIGIRKVIANWCRDRSIGKYTISQEEEYADGKKPDCRFTSSNFDAPVPMELKLADNWSGPALFERLENQLNNDYLRDGRSNRGIFVLVYRGKKQSWEIPYGNENAIFSELVESLQNHWNTISTQYPKTEQITVIGIDLTKRFK